jgi:hypothetical protein
VRRGEAENWRTKNARESGSRGGVIIILDSAPDTAKLRHFARLMDPFLLKTLHIAGAFGLFTSLGATLLGGSGKKGAAILHGISLVLILLVGFAMLKKPPMDQSWWMIKLGLWLFIGAAPALAKRKVLPTSVVLILCIAAAAAAAWLGLAKPF